MGRIWLAVAALVFSCGVALADSDTVKPDLPDGYLNLRSGPGVNHDVLAQVPAGATLEIGQCVLPDDNGQTTSGWCEARWHGIAGFVSDSGLSGDYLNADDLNGWDGSSAFADAPSSAAPAPTVATGNSQQAGGEYMVPAGVSGGSVPMRSGPGVTFDDIVDIPAGATGLQVGQCMAPQDNGQSHKDWCIVTWNGHRGFTSSCCIAPQTAAVPAPSPPKPTRRQEPKGATQSIGYEVGESDGLSFQCDKSFKNCAFKALVRNSGEDSIVAGPGPGEVTWTQYPHDGSDALEQRCNSVGESGKVGTTPYTCRVNVIRGRLFVMSDLQYASGETLVVFTIDMKTLACGFAARDLAQHVETHFAMDCSPALRAEE